MNEADMKALVLAWAHYNLSKIGAGFVAWPKRS
jgi:hypothetical protein